jgi:hypothetical protein
MMAGIYITKIQSDMENKFIMIKRRQREFSKSNILTPTRRFDEEKTPNE